MYHYTPAGEAIKASNELWPSSHGDFGPGIYFTNLPPELFKALQTGPHRISPFDTLRLLYINNVLPPQWNGQTSIDVVTCTFFESEVQPPYPLYLYGSFIDDIIAPGVIGAIYVYRTASELPLAAKQCSVEPEAITIGSN